MQQQSKFKKLARAGDSYSPPRHSPLIPPPSRPHRIARKGTVVADSALVRNERAQKLLELLPGVPAAVDAAFGAALADMMEGQKKKVCSEV
jgi:hypothetical protein